MGFWENYQEWLKVADTALPRNIFGYILVVCLQPLRADPFTTKPYDDRKEVAKCGRDIGKRNFLKEKLPEREGPRPEMLKFMAPNRQVSQKTGEEMHNVHSTGQNIRDPADESNSFFPKQLTSSWHCTQHTSLSRLLSSRNPAMRSSSLTTSPHPTRSLRRLSGR